MRFLPQRDIRVVSDLDRGMEWIENRLLAEAVGAGSSTATEPGGSDDNVAVPSVDLRGMLAAHFSPEALKVLLGLCEVLDLPQADE